jgi:hypothetical protein
MRQLPISIHIAAVKPSLPRVALRANDDFPGALTAFERAIALGREDAHANVGSTRLRVSINRRAHSSSPSCSWSDMRSIPPQQLAPLANLNGVAWFAL